MQFQQAQQFAAAAAAAQQQQQAQQAQQTQQAQQAQQSQQPVVQQAPSPQAQQAAYAQLLHAQQQYERAALLMQAWISGIHPNPEGLIRVNEATIPLKRVQPSIFLGSIPPEVCVSTNSADYGYWLKHLRFKELAAHYFGKAQKRQLRPFACSLY